MRQFLFIALIALNVFSIQFASAGFVLDKISSWFNKNEKKPTSFLPSVIPRTSGLRAPVDVTSIHDAAPMIGGAVNKIVTGSLQGASGLMSNVIGRGRTNRMDHGTYIDPHATYNDIPQNNNNGQYTPQNNNGQYGQSFAKANGQNGALHNGRYGAPVDGKPDNTEYGGEQPNGEFIDPALINGQSNNFNGQNH